MGKSRFLRQYWSEYFSGKLHFDFDMKTEETGHKTGSLHIYDMLGLIWVNIRPYLKLNYDCPECSFGWQLMRAC